jgi:hypothetical protein
MVAGLSLQLGKEYSMKKRTHWTAALCLGLMTMAGGHSLGAAERERQREGSHEAKMRAEGWKKIAEGVFERRRGATKVEHLSYGREGLAWTIGSLVRRRDALQREHGNYPSEDLANVIDNLEMTIAKSRRELRNLPVSSSDSLSSMSAAVEGGNCDIFYSATGDAYGLTTSQGVGAIADAKFNDNCGKVGDTYAYAYARATRNGTTTAVIQEDPHSGTAVTSHAAASVAGSLDCFSETYASVQSTDLQISYSTSDTNYSCLIASPPNPCESVTSAAIQAVIDKIAASRAKAESDVAAHGTAGGPGYPEAATANLSYLTQARDTMLYLLDYLRNNGLLDPPPFVTNPTGSNVVHTYVLNTVNYLHHARHWSIVSVAWHNSADARDSFELTTQALELIEPLGAQAGRCFMLAG